MSNHKTKPLDLSINPFSIAAQLKTSANNGDDEVSTTSEEENNFQGPLNKYMFCLWCKEAGKNNNFTKGCEFLKKQSLDRHIITSDHQIVCAARIQSQVTLYSSFAVQAGTDQIKIMRNMRNIYFLIQHNLSTNIFEDLCKLSEIQRAENQNQFECGTEILNIFNNDFSANDERAPYGSYQNNVSAHEFIKLIGHVIEQVLAIVSKHSIAPAKPLYRFLGLISLTNSTANTIIAKINRFVLAKNISYDKLMHICTDGASTMIGIHSGVATQLKNKNPFILEHHCISHKLALAAKDAAKQRIMHLKMIEENIGDPQLTVLNIIETRWLSLSNIIQNLHQILNSISDALLEDLNENMIAQALYNSIDKNFIITTKFFADILGILKRMNLLFQKNNITIHEVKTQLDITIHTIQVQFLGVEPTWGIHLRKYIIDNEISPTELPIIITKFACAIVESLEKRFPNRIQIDAFHIFDLMALPVNNSDFQKYGEDEIKILEAWKRIFLDLPTFNEIYPETAKLISILINLPLTNAVVERIFSRQNLIKTKLQNRMSIFTLNYLLLVSFNGPKLENFDFQLVYQEWCKLDR
ncbi:28572_t:CDS:2 [Racocetra persica]|uniref:28572_t:CDS:1 n=1 Tax=Racocetra persica TaxID=160502 RepID=A0ACA9PG44_9GLOM|nr:28572_t:CDS:2 [Racocetra persica]